MCRIHLACALLFVTSCSRAKTSDATDAGLERFVIVRSRGEGADTRAERAIGGHLRRGDRVSVGINPCAHRFYALVLVNDGKVVVAVAGMAGEIGPGAFNELVLRRADGTDVRLVDGARVVALFSNEPIDSETAASMVLSNARPEGIEIESETLAFDL